MIVVKIALQISVAHLIEVFELAEIVALLLDRVVRQVNELVVEILKVELSRARPNVTILIEVAF